MFPYVPDYFWLKTGRQYVKIISRNSFIPRMMLSSSAIDLSCFYQVPCSFLSRTTLIQVKDLGQLRTSDDREEGCKLVPELMDFSFSLWRHREACFNQNTHWWDLGSDFCSLTLAPRGKQEFMMALQLFTQAYYLKANMAYNDLANSLGSPWPQQFLSIWQLLWCF